MLNNILFSRAQFDFFLWYVIIIRCRLTQTRQRLVVIFSGFACKGHAFSLMILTTHLLGWRLRARPHTRIHRFAVLWYHMLVVSSTLFFYYNVLKSACATSARRRTSVIFRLIVHNRECCAIIPESILSRIHLSVLTKRKTTRNGCRDVLGSWIFLECDLRLTITFRVLLKLALTWFDHRNIFHEHAAHLEDACVFALSRLLYVRLCHYRLRISTCFICVIRIHGIVLGL